MSDRLLLVMNCGSSSLKFALFQAAPLSCVAEGLAESLAHQSARFKYSLHLPDGTHTKDSVSLPNADHAQAIQHAISWLTKHFSLERDLAGIGHRVVHGGELFACSTLISDEVERQIEACASLAPLHNPANLKGIRLLKQSFPDLPQVAVFDTAFHQSMPPEAYLYALPYSLYEALGIRRYGFHGTSHRFVTQEAARFLGRDPVDLNMVSAHLGNGASVTAIRGGKSIDTSMGMTPLEGLVMGTRSGDLDPGIFNYLAAHDHSPDRIDRLLNKESGLLGLSGCSHDMRTLCERAAQGDRRCELAINVFCHRLAKYIAAMMSSLPHCEAIVFTGGIGENAAQIRERTVARLTAFGLSLSSANNLAASGPVAEISSTQSRSRILVIQTDEEKMIAQDLLTLID